MTKAERLYLFFSHFTGHILMNVIYCLWLIWSADIAALCPATVHFLCSPLLKIFSFLKTFFIFLWQPMEKKFLCM